jgi:hypothetical protein
MKFRARGLTAVFLFSQRRLQRASAPSRFPHRFTAMGSNAYRDGVLKFSSNGR